MASDRTRELAKELRRQLSIERCPHPHQLVRRKVDCDECFDAEWAATLDAFERETRLDEAKWWHREEPEWLEHDCIEMVPKATRKFEYRGCKRIAELAAQPTPEVKK